jgi:two-component system chemotaxis response regulator CheY
MRFLIVDDDFTNRKVLQKMLSEYGDSEIAANGREAVIAFEEAWREEQPYDLIFLDIMMPEMNGHEVLQSIRNFEQERDIHLGSDLSARIIMTTALDDRRSILDSYRDGTDGYLVKPITLDSLRKELQRLRVIDEMS